MDGAIEEIEFLVRSEARVRILSELADGDRTRDEFRETIDVDRTTIQRNLAALRANGWIYEDDRIYSLEPHREPAVRELLSLLDSVRLTGQLEQFLTWINLSHLEFDITRLRDADIWTAEPGDPWAMVNRHVSGLRGMDEGRLLLPVTGLGPKRALRERVVEHDASAELIVSPDVLETYRSNPEYADYYRELRESDRVRYWVHDGEIPFYLGLLDETVQIGVSENEEPRALLESTDSEVREWANDFLDDYRERATEIRSD